MFAVPVDLIRRAAHLKAAGHSWETIATRLHLPADVLEFFPADAPGWAAHYANGCKVANDEFVADARAHARKLMRSEDEKTALKAAELGVKLQMTLVRHHHEWRSPASELPPLRTGAQDPFAKVAEILKRWQEEDDEDEDEGGRPKKPAPPPPPRGGEGEKKNSLTPNPSPTGEEGDQPPSPKPPSAASNAASGRIAELIVANAHSVRYDPSRTTTLTGAAMRTPLFAVLSLLPLALIAADRPTPLPGQAHRSESVAVNGMVCTSHPIAAQVGLDVLKSGGNAVDAAIATSAAMGLMEPTSCGMGGDLFAIVWDAQTQKLHGLNASGPAPKKASVQYFKDKKLNAIPERGPLSWSVPGCVEGWDQLRRKFGTKSFKELLAPSIRYAEEGVPVPEVIAGYFKSSERMLLRDPGLSEAFCPGGRVPRAGEVFKNPHVAKSLKLIAEGGRDAYYQGPIAEAIVKLSDEKGGLFTKADFAEFTAEWVDPVKTTYRGYDVWELPPPGQGIAALQMLNLLEPHDLKKLGPTSPDYWHLLVEAKKLAFADRAKYYTDPRFAQVPTSTLISKEYAAERAKSLDMKKAAVGVTAGDAKLGKSETIYLCVVDKDRNCVSLIQSNYNGFGSGLAAPGTGFGLQNRGCLFAVDENHANKIEGGKRPFHTIIPAMVTKDGKPWLTFGVMGGDMQPQGHVQVLVNLIDFGMNVQAAGDAARVEHVGSATPTGTPEAESGGTIQAEPGIPDAVVKELESRGHIVRRVRVNGGGYQGIKIDPTTNVLHGGTESRKDGVAAGY
jgi:gamma-glutamyltranspeptidase/glutathione hydrolase